MEENASMSSPQLRISMDTRIPGTLAMGNRPNSTDHKVLLRRQLGTRRLSGPVGQLRQPFLGYEKEMKLCDWTLNGWRVWETFRQ